MAAPGQLSVSLSLSSSELEAGDTIEIVARVQNHSSDWVTYSYAVPPFTIEFLGQSGSSSLLHPPNRLAVQIVHTLGPGEAAEATYRFEGDTWPAGPLPPGAYQVVASIWSRPEFISAPVLLEVR